MGACSRSRALSGGSPSDALIVASRRAALARRDSTNSRSSSAWPSRTDSLSPRSIQRALAVQPCLRAWSHAESAKSSRSARASGSSEHERMHAIWPLVSRARAGGVTRRMLWQRCLPLQGTPSHSRRSEADYGAKSAVYSPELPGPGRSRASSLPQRPRLMSRRPQSLPSDGSGDSSR